jgi:hypothetical protein
MTTVSIRLTAVAGLMMAPAGPPLAAQRATEAQDARLRASCRLAAQAIATGRLHPHYSWAVDQIRSCEQSAGAVLAGRWAALREADRQELLHLGFSSRSVRDQRIFDAVLRVAGSREAAPLVRLTALRVLISYTDPAQDVLLEDLESPKDNRTLARVTHFAPSDGAVPLAAGNRATFLALLRELGEREPDPQVAAAARYILRNLDE